MTVPRRWLDGFFGFGCGLFFGLCLIAGCLWLIRAIVDLCRAIAQ